MRVFVTVALLAIVGAGAVYGQTGMRHGMGMHGGAMHGGGMHGAGETQVSMVRHRYVHQHGIDAQYAGKKSPLPPSAAVVAAGQRIYAQQCAQCHGPAGRGDGEAGQALTPPPADLAVAARLPMATDAYLYWTVAEGGVPVGSAMPPFKSVLTETEIWQLIGYLRSL
jgi:hypothetical protein